MFIEKLRFELNEVHLLNWDFFIPKFFFLRPTNTINTIKFENRQYIKQEEAGALNLSE